MKHSLAVTLAFALVVPSTASGQKAKDAVIVDPIVHNVLFENDHVRVFEARASYPTASPMHSHPPFVFIGLEQARVKMGLPDGTKTMFDIHPGLVAWLGDGGEHSWDMVSGKVRVIAVEVKSAVKPTAGPLPAVVRKANDAVTVDPDTHHVIVDNDHVRIFDARAAKGKKSPMHSHTPFVFVSLGTARFALTLPDGKRVIFDTYPGQAIWMEDAEHSWEVLAGEAHVVAVEVKSAQRIRQGAKTN